MNRRWLAGAVLGTLLVLALGIYHDIGDFRAAQAPVLEGKWWGGHYALPSTGKQPCAARFQRMEPGVYEMLLVSSKGSPERFVVLQATQDKHAVEVLGNNDSGKTIKASQLYPGKRYVLERLFSSRWRDSFERNEDIAIRGRFSSESGPSEFTIEPMTEDQFRGFWTRSLGRAETPEEVLTFTDRPPSPPSP